jgi:hypothetical protein
MKTQNIKKIIEIIIVRITIAEMLVWHFCFVLLLSLDDKIDDYDGDDNDDNGYGPKRNKNNNVAAAAALRLTRTIMTKLACDLNGTDPANL